MRTPSVVATAPDLHRTLRQRSGQPALVSSGLSLAVRSDDRQTGPDVAISWAHL